MTAELQTKFTRLIAKVREQEKEIATALDGIRKMRVQSAAKANLEEDVKALSDAEIIVQNLMLGLNNSALALEELG